MFRILFAINCFAILLVFASCSSFKTNNCIELAGMLSNLTSATELTLGESSDWTRELEIEKISSQSSGLPNEILISTGKNYSWSFRKGFDPLYWQLEQNAKMLKVLNKEMTLYLKALSEIESGGELSEKDFIKISSSAKIAAGDLAKIAEFPQFNEYKGLISFSVANIFEQYIETRNKALFHQIVKANQKAVEDWAAIYTAVLRTAAVNIKTNYSSTMLVILEQEEQKSKSARKKVCETIFSINDRLISSLDKMELIEKAVGRIVEIHKKLPERDNKLKEMMTELQFILFHIEGIDSRRKK